MSEVSPKLTKVISLSFGYTWQDQEGRDNFCDVQLRRDECGYLVEANLENLESHEPIFMEFATRELAVAYFEETVKKVLAHPFLIFRTGTP